MKTGSLNAQLLALGLFGTLMASDAGVVRPEISGAMLVAPELVALERISIQRCHLQLVNASRVELRFETVEFSYPEAVEGHHLVHDISAAPRASLPAAQVCGSP